MGETPPLPKFAPAKKDMTIELNGVPFVLLYEKAIYKPDERLLLIADVHLGKASHFRKEGISIPAQAQMADYDNLERLFVKTNPEKVYFLGDLFHSSFNRDWHYFCDLIKKFPSIKFLLVRGNHDLINDSLFNELCIEVVDEVTDELFSYTHEPQQKVAAGKINIVGHIHPGIVLSGMGRQSLKIPCFHVTTDQVILPAFGILTGLYSMTRGSNCRIYGVLPDMVREIAPAVV